MRFLSLTATYILYSVEVTFDEQCDITWVVPQGVELIPLFLTTSFNIERDLMDLIGGEDGKTFRFLVSERKNVSNTQPHCVYVPRWRGG